LQNTYKIIQKNLVKLNYEKFNSMYPKKVAFVIMILNYGCGPCCNYVTNFYIAAKSKANNNFMYEIVVADCNLKPCS